MTSPSSNPKRIKPGLVELLEAAATIIENEASALKRSRTINGRWSARDPIDVEVRAACDDMLAVAKGLRAARGYHAANVFGGPVATFDGIADLIRAGDSVELAMRVFGVEWAE